MEWSDLRYFLALVEEGSVRAAASKLKVSHSTITRRISALEKDLGARLFDRLASGYTLTSEGEDILAEAQAIGQRLFSLERRVSGKDDSMDGPLRVTMPDVFAAQLLMPDIVAFTRKYPQIDLDIIATYDSLSLAQREADIAIRITDNPPENSIGRHLATYKKANYVSRDYLKTVNLAELGKSAQWIGWNDKTQFPDWVASSAYPDIPARHHLNNPLLQVNAVKSGLGIAMIPCFIADQHDDLIRVPDDRSVDAYQVWLITHVDLRESSKVQAFNKAMISAFERLGPLLRGECYQRAHSLAPVEE